ncbi:hypothetical protein PFISCL1PPCAC_6852, partial [Pristionchus fissidentatus]
LIFMAPPLNAAEETKEDRARKLDDLLEEKRVAEENEQAARERYFAARKALREASDAVSELNAKIIKVRAARQARGEENGLMTLPTELLTKVFDWFGTKDRVEVSRTCKRFHEVEGSLKEAIDELESTDGTCGLRFEIHLLSPRHQKILIPLLHQMKVEESIQIETEPTEPMLTYNDVASIIDKNEDLEVVKIEAGVGIDASQIIQLHQTVKGMADIERMSLFIHSKSIIDEFLLNFYGIDPSFLNGAIRLHDFHTNLTHSEVFYEMELPYVAFHRREEKGESGTMIFTLSIQSHQRGQVQTRDDYGA